MAHYETTSIRGNFYIPFHHCPKLSVHEQFFYFLRRGICPVHLTPVSVCVQGNKIIELGSYLHIDNEWITEGFEIELYRWNKWNFPIKIMVILTLPGCQSSSHTYFYLLIMLQTWSSATGRYIQNMMSSFSRIYWMMSGICYAVLDNFLE